MNLVYIMYGIGNEFSIIYHEERNHSYVRIEMQHY